MNSPLKEIVHFTFDSINTKDLVLSLHANLQRRPPAKALTKGQLKTLAEEIFLKNLIKKL